MGNTNNLNRNLGIDNLDVNIDMGIENQLNDMKFETAVLILKMNPQDFELKSKIEGNDSTEQKILGLKGRVSYNTLRKKAIDKFLRGVILDAKNIDSSVLANIRSDEIKDILDSDKDLRNKIKENLLSGTMNINDLRNVFNSLQLNESYFNTFINTLAYGTNADTPGESMDQLINLQSAYNHMVQVKINNYKATHGISPDSNKLNEIKNREFEKLIDQKNGRGFTAAVLIPVYQDIETAREAFEAYANRISEINRIGNEQGGEFWQQFREKGALGMINYYIEKSPMNRNHKDAAKFISQLAISIGLIYGLFKYLTSDCLIKLNGKCQLKGGLFTKLFIFAGSEFAYNWGTNGKHSLFELIGGFLTGGLDKSYIPTFDSSTASNTQESINNNDIEQARVDVEVRQQITAPLLVKILFSGEKISDFKNEIKDNNGEISIEKLINYLKQKAERDNKYAFGYMLVKGIKDSNSSHKKEELKKAVKEGIDMLDGYGENKKVDEIYDNEYLKRYKEVAEIKDEIDRKIQTLSGNVKHIVESAKNDISRQILKKYLSNSLVGGNGRKIVTKAGLIRYINNYIENTLNTGISNFIPTSTPTSTSTSTPTSTPTSTSTNPNVI